MVAAISLKVCPRIVIVLTFEALFLAKTLRRGEADTIGCGFRRRENDLAQGPQTRLLQETKHKKLGQKQAKPLENKHNEPYHQPGHSKYLKTKSIKYTILLTPKQEVPGTTVPFLGFAF